MLAKVISRGVAASSTHTMRADIFLRERERRKLFHSYRWPCTTPDFKNTGLFQTLLAAFSFTDLTLALRGPASCSRRCRTIFFSLSFDQDSAPRPDCRIYELEHVPRPFPCVYIQCSVYPHDLITICTTIHTHTDDDFAANSHQLRFVDTARFSDE